MSIRRTVVACLILMLGAGCAPTELVDASGAEIYEQLCARCHGVDLEGGTAPAMDIAAASDEELATVVREGRGAMPGYESTLTDDQIERIVEFLRSESSAG